MNTIIAEVYVAATKLVNWRPGAAIKVIML
jgi:hypothetical protein